MKTIEDHILEIKESKNIKILSFYNTPIEIQENSDYVGGFRRLYNYCKEIDARVIMWCGPDFLADLLYVMFPTKIFFKIQENSECNLNQFTTTLEIKELKNMFPIAKIAAYYKSNVKTLSLADVIIDDCGIEKSIRNIEDKNIIFIPDYSVGIYAKSKVLEKEIIISHGYCPPLYNVTSDSLQAVKLKHPESKVAAHPETNYHLHSSADIVAGYDQFYEYCEKQISPLSFILIYNHFYILKLRKDFPHHTFHRPDSNLKCKGTKNLTKEDLLTELDKLNFKIEVPSDYVLSIEKKLKAMLELTDNIE